MSPNFTLKLSSLILTITSLHRITVTLNSYKSRLKSMLFRVRINNNALFTDNQFFQHSSQLEMFITLITVLHLMHNT